MKAARDVWWWGRDDEHTLWFGCAVWLCLWLEEALGVPPIVPRAFDGDWVVARGVHALGEIYETVRRSYLRVLGGVNGPFFSPLGVVLTNSGSSAFLGFSAFTFFSPAGAEALFAVLDAFNASICSLLASRLAVIWCK